MRSVLMLPWLVACYPDLSDSLDPGPTELERTGDGLLLDATDYDVWVGLDLDTQTFVEESDPTWDLAAKRFEVKLNGGVSGDQGVEVVDVDPDAPEVIPEDGWYTDEPDADGDGLPEYALKDWYIYDYGTHLLSPDARAWFLRTTEGAIVEIVFDSYYDSAGTPARIQMSVTER